MLYMPNAIVAYCRRYLSRPSRRKLGYGPKQPNKLSMSVQATKHLILKHFFYDKNVNVAVSFDEAFIVQWINNNTSRRASESRVILGLDIEWKPSYERKNNSPISSILQLAVEDSVLIIQLKYLQRIPVELKDLIGCKNVLKVGVGILDDLNKLNDHHGIPTGAYLDLSSAATKAFNIRKTGLASLTNYFFGIEMNKRKSVQMSDWERLFLTDQQITYAANDALIGLAVYKKMCEYPIFIEYLRKISNLSQNVDTFDYEAQVEWVDNLMRDLQIQRQHEIELSSQSTSESAVSNPVLEVDDGPEIASDRPSSCTQITENVGVRIGSLAPSVDTISTIKVDKSISVGSNHCPIVSSAIESISTKPSQSSSTDTTSALSPLVNQASASSSLDLPKNHHHEISNCLSSQSILLMTKKEWRSLIRSNVFSSSIERDFILKNARHIDWVTFEKLSRTVDHSGVLFWRTALESYLFRFGVTIQLVNGATNHIDPIIRILQQEIELIEIENTRSLQLSTITQNTMSNRIIRDDTGNRKYQLMSSSLPQKPITQVHTITKGTNQVKSESTASKMQLPVSTRLRNIELLQKLMASTCKSDQPAYFILLIDKLCVSISLLPHTNNEKRARKDEVCKAVLETLIRSQRDDTEFDWQEFVLSQQSTAPSFFVKALNQSFEVMYEKYAI